MSHEAGAQVGKVRGGGAPARLRPGVGVGGCRDDREAKRLNAAPGATGLPVSASCVSWARCGLPGRGGGGLRRRGPPTPRMTCLSSPAVLGLQMPKGTRGRVPRTVCPATTKGSPSRPRSFCPDASSAEPRKELTLGKWGTTCPFARNAG